MPPQSLSSVRALREVAHVGRNSCLLPDEKSVQRRCLHKQRRRLYIQRR